MNDYLVERGQECGSGSEPTFQFKDRPAQLRTTNSVCEKCDEVPAMRGVCAATICHSTNGPIAVPIEAAREVAGF